MRMMLALAALCLCAPTARAAVKTRVIEYKHGDAVLEGYLAYDDAAKEKRPGVLVVHEWTGHDRYARARAEQFATLGYVAFAVDMYGKGVLAKDAKEAAKLAAPFKGDRKRMRDRAAAGLDVLRKQPQTDPIRLAAIGYCFGGTTALELARAGAELNGVVAFHANLATPRPADAKNIKAKLLVLHGADDPIVPLEEIEGFVDEMRKANVDWQLVSYGGAVHSFTNPAAGTDPARGVAFHPAADRRSFAAMQLFLLEALAPEKKR